MRMEKIRVILVDDHSLVRKGVRAVLEAEESIEIVAEAQNGDEALERLVELEPHVLLTDISMDGMSGLDLCEEALEEFPGVKVLILSMHLEPEYIVSAFDKGATGFLNKDASDKEIIDAIKSVHKGEKYLTPTTSRMLANAFIKGKSEKGE